MLIRFRCGKVKATIYVRGLAPSKTRKALLEKIPVRTTARVRDETIFIDLDLHLAPEGHRCTFGEGDVAYWPPASALLIILKGCKTLPSPATYLGFVVTGLDELRQLHGNFDAELSFTCGPH